MLSFILWAPLFNRSALMPSTWFRPMARIQRTSIDAQLILGSGSLHLDRKLPSLQCCLRKLQAFGGPRALVQPRYALLTVQRELI